jgi:hypothetical protein
MLQVQLAKLVRRRDAGNISDAVYAALYFLHWQAALHGRRFASRKFKRDPRPNHLLWLNGLEGITGAELRERLVYYFERYNFLGVIPNVGAALLAWLRGCWPLYLCGHIPGPEEMLQMQARGTRAVTILSEYPRVLQPVLNKPNAFAFMVHDLEHAFKFFHDPDLHEGQKGFLSQILTATKSGLLDGTMRDPVFVDKFNYLISDMNTHAMHSLQFLRAILIEHHLRAAGKPAWEVLPSHAQGEVEAIMHFFDGFQAAVAGN